MTENTLIEQSMLIAGQERYVERQAKATDHNELTSAEQKLFTEAVGKVAEAMQTALEEHSGPGRKPAWFEPLTALGALQCAVISLRMAFCAINSRTGYTDVATDIGRQIELEQIAQAVKASQCTEGMTPKEEAAAQKMGEKMYEKLVKRVSKLRSLDTRGKVFSKLAQEAGFWDPLPVEEHAKIGSALFNFVLSSTDIFVVYLNEGDADKQFMGVTLTDDASARLDKIASVEAWMHPVYKPMLRKPKPWDGAYTGCYEDTKLAATVKIVRGAQKKQLQSIDAAIKEEPAFVRALNAIQAVPLQANPVVVKWLDTAFNSDYTLSSFPEPVLEVTEGDSDEQRKAKKKHNTEVKALRLELKKTIALAHEYEGYGTFYLPSTLDWRGRVYAKPHLNHQREDHCKAIFQFDEGCVLTPEGAVWLAIHVCNSGAYEWKPGVKWDKAPLPERYQWTRDNTERICAMVKDPAADLWWTEADSPFMFLAACEAWAGYIDDPEGYVCHLPVGVDGSCSGLQHFSAMLRDPVGGGHVNLLPQDSPADVYQVVADVTRPLVEADAAAGEIHAARWLRLGITRKTTKTCVMTYVYGSKQFGFAEHLAEAFHAKLLPIVTAECPKEAEEADWHYTFRLEREVKATGFYLAKHIWNGVQGTVKAAAEAMEWLQVTASMMASEGIPLQWVTPAGFPVLNAYYAPQIERVELTLWDRAMNLPKRVVPRVFVGNTKELLPRKCRSSISPNFVHSLDAAHLHLAVLKAQEEGIKSVMLIHDSFSCLPNDMPRFSQIVRETFVELYANNDPLNDIYEFAKSVLSEEGLKKLTPPPAKGALDLEEVLKSHYAFA